MIKYTLLLILAPYAAHSALQAGPQPARPQASETLSSTQARCQSGHYAEKAAYWQDHIFNEGYTAQMRNTAQKIAQIYSSIAQHYENLIHHAPATRSALIERDITPLLTQAATLEKAFPATTAPETMYEKVRRLEHENAELKKKLPRSAQTTRRTIK